MFFLDYWQNLTPCKKRKLAQQVDSSSAYLSQIAHGRRKAGPELAEKIAIATGQDVPKHELRPDLWPKPQHQYDNSTSTMINIWNVKFKVSNYPGAGKKLYGNQ